MERYANKNGDSAVSTYEIGINYIYIGFKSGSTYEYTYASAGPVNIEKMKALARAGRGLNTFITKYVNNKYAQKIR